MSNAGASSVAEARGAFLQAFLQKIKNTVSGFRADQISSPKGPLTLSFLPEIQFKLISGRTPFGRLRNCDWTAFSVNVMGTCCNWQVKINLQIPHFLIWKF